MKPEFPVQGREVKADTPGSLSSSQRPLQLGPSGCPLAQYRVDRPSARSQLSLETWLGDVHRASTQTGRRPPKRKGRRGRGQGGLFPGLGCGGREIGQGDLRGVSCPASGRWCSHYRGNPRLTFRVTIQRQHHILTSAHPSPLSASRGFMGNDHFKKCNEWLEGKYGEGKGIDWTSVGKEE